MTTRETATGHLHVRKRLGCGDVAMNRATRYARQHRAARPFWPLIVVAIFVALIFQRWLRRTWGSSVQGHSPINQRLANARNALPQANEEPDAAGGARSDQDERVPQYRPSSYPRSAHVAELVAFLVRNRGRLDTRVIQKKWDDLDQLSLPLALYLREVEAMATWDDLEREIAATQYEGPALNMELPKSRRHRKILQLLPGWERRGEELLSTGEPETSPDPDPKAGPTTDVVTPDTTPPKP